MKLTNKILIFSFAGVLVAALLMNKKNAEPVTKKTTPDLRQADTLIPQGYVLVPLELANIEAVAALIDQYGLIDLYGGDTQQSSQLIAGRIKILKAPLNPNQYAVMVTEEISHEIMKYRQTTFWAVVHNPQQVARKPAPPVKRMMATQETQLHLPPVRKPINAVIEVDYYQGDAQ